MTVLFFMWGFMTVFNDILIPRFKDAFTLDYFHAMLVPFAFFGAYFIGSLLYFAVSATLGDPIARLGYKNGVVIGLLISAMGSALFWPAATLLALLVIQLTLGVFVILHTKPPTLTTFHVLNGAALLAVSLLLALRLRRFGGAALPAAGPSAEPLPARAIA
jgi:hypothetical protein